MRSNSRWPVITGAMLILSTVFVWGVEQTLSPQPDKTLLDARAVESGFQSVFNGKDLTGWDGNPKLWSVKDGAITGQTTVENPAKGNTFLIWTNGTVADFELRCMFRLKPGDSHGFANSGIQYRSKVLDPANWVVGGYQADMEAGPTFTGILYEEAMTRGIMAARGEKVVWGKDCQKNVVGSLGTAQELGAAIHQLEWSDYLIVARGNHLQQFINGRQTVDVVDDCESKRAMSGVIALQLHAGSPMMVQFKNIRIKQLSGHAGDDGLAGLQGKWVVVSAESDGAPVESDELKGAVLTIKSNSYTVAFPDRTDEGTFKLDTAKNPHHMDVMPGNGGDTLSAIYQLEGTTLRVCYGHDGAPRPTEFKTSSGSSILLITWKRK
jgi:uncharacterized protein (TIGR03067 family)